jgi:ubiquinone/menaquinone biosynthesis C-methylase UbiE
MVMRRRYSGEPQDKNRFTQQFDRFYTRFARWYAWFIRVFPFWRHWLDQALPHITGPRVLEISFGTGYLLSRYAGRYDVSGVDLNLRLTQLAREMLRRQGLEAGLQVADVGALPYPEAAFDCVVNTMAFSGYPDAAAALDEIRRVLIPGGRLVMIDVGYPLTERPGGFIMASLWKLAGDLLREMVELLSEHGFETSVREIGGFGSVHLYICQKATDVETLLKSGGN